jgi:hypothetical protein
VAKRAVRLWADIWFIFLLAGHLSLLINRSIFIWMSGNEYYDPSLAENNEDRLVAVTVNLKRDSPPLPPYQPNPSHKSRRKQGASQGDTVLLNHMDPNRPDIALDGGRTVLCQSPSPPRRGPPSREDPRDWNTEVKGQGVHHLQRNQESKEFEKERALNSPGMKASKNTLFPQLIFERTSNSPELKAAESKPEEPQGAQKMSVVAATRSLPRQPIPLTIDATRNGNDGFVRPPLTARLPPQKIEQSPRRPSLPPNFRSSESPHDSSPVPAKAESLLTSPIGQHLRDPPTPAHTLPKLQNSATVTSPQSAGSPQSKQTLPEIGPLIQIAKEQNEITSRQRGSSFSQMGLSPPYTGTTSQFPPFSNHGSPTESAMSPISHPAPSIPNHPFGFRRQSVTSDNTYPLPLYSASTASDAYTSPSDVAFSPSETQGTAITTPSERGVRIGGAALYQNTTTTLPPLSAATSPQTGAPYNADHLGSNAPTPTAHPANKLALPSPHPSHQPHQPTSATPPSGQYKCNFPGCTASPFQTQYLLNSHTTVHSSDRPHYCPVPGCRRGPGGQGFKRKNEMKRHGLVHDSPGYICPFCPEREHRYPRPDNLQRHVRVHHADVQTGDPRLREVLEKKGLVGRAAGRGGKARAARRASLQGAPAIAGIGVGG